MAENTKIEWCDHTFNPWEGCQKVGPGCDNCYAENRNARFGGGTAINWGPGTPRRRTSAANWNLPVKWNRRAGIMQHAWAIGVELHGGDEAACIAAGYIKPKRPKVFCASLADVFDNAIDPQWRDDLWQLIQDTPNLDWLLLTKRIGNVFGMLPDGWAFGHGPWPNVWIGATIVNQEEADRDIPKLLAVPAAKRFLSMEPLLGLVDIRKYLNEVWCEDCDWAGDGCAGPEDGDSECPECGGVVHFRCGERINRVIVGGESGPGARPMHPDWARSLRDQCAAANALYLFKQWGEWVSVSEVEGPGNHFHFPDGATVRRTGKKLAGRALDGITHDGVPHD